AKRGRDPADTVRDEEAFLYHGKKGKQRKNLKRTRLASRRGGFCAVDADSYAFCCPATPPGDASFDNASCFPDDPIATVSLYVAPLVGIRMPLKPVFTVNPMAGPSGRMDESRHTVDYPEVNPGGDREEKAADNIDTASYDGGDYPWERSSGI
ncbi:MAG: hypothetical protein ABIK28_11505, partial [Planctomycetota bacterium]